MYCRKLMFMGSIFVISGLIGCGSRAGINESGGASHTIADKTPVEATVSPERTALPLSTSDDIVLEIEHQVYTPDMRQLTYFITNTTQQPVLYGAEYELQVQLDGTWTPIPLKPNYAWNAIGYTLEAMKTRAGILSLDLFDYEFKPGTYRLVKKVGESIYAVQFQLGESNISSEQPYGYMPLEQLPKTYEKEAMIANGDIYAGNNEVANEEKWVRFFGHVSIGAAAMMRMDFITVEGDPIIVDIIYEDGRFLMREDNSRDGFGVPTNRIEQFYSYLITDGEQIYLSNSASFELSKEYMSEANNNLRNITPYQEFPDKQETIQLVQNMMETRVATDITTYCSYNADGTYKAGLVTTPLEYGIVGKQSSSIHEVKDPEQIAIKITTIQWMDLNKVEICCETTEDKFYYIIYDVEKDQEVEQYYK